MGSGSQATVAGGGANNALGNLATVSGGAYNTAEGEFSSVLGGHTNVANGKYSQVLASQKATATHESSVVISASDSNCESVSINSVTMCAEAFAIKSSSFTINGNDILALMTTLQNRVAELEMEVNSI